MRIRTLRQLLIYFQPCIGRPTLLLATRWSVQFRTAKPNNRLHFDSLFSCPQSLIQGLLIQLGIDSAGGLLLRLPPRDGRRQILKSARFPHFIHNVAFLGNSARAPLLCGSVVPPPRPRTEDERQEGDDSG